MSAVEDLRAQANQFLTYVTTTALQPVLGADLPFIGNALASSATSLLLDGLRSQIDDALDLVQSTAGQTTTQLAQEIATRLNGIGGGIVTASAANGRVTIEIHAQDSVEVDASGFKVDVGYDALGLKLTGGVSAGLDLGVNAKLRFDVAVGNETGKLYLIDTDEKLLTLDVTGSLDNFGGGVQLGFLDVALTDKQATPEISLSTSIDYEAPGTPITTAITALSATNLKPLISGDASVRFGVVAGLSTDLLPEISADLVASYTLENYDPSAGGPLTLTPNVYLDDVTLDVGEVLNLLGDVFGPIIRRVFGAYPIAPLLNTLTAPIPLISEGSKDAGFFEYLNVIGDDRINLLDLAAGYMKASGMSTEVIEAFSRAFSLIQALATIDDAADMGKIVLGDYTVVGSGPPAPLQGGAAQVFASGADALAKLGEALDAYASDNPEAQPVGGEGQSGGAGALSEILGDSGLALPILDLATIGKLLTNGGDKNNPINLITYDVPELAFNAEFHKFFPVIGPLGVAFDGNFGAKIDVNIGYDTAGLANGGSFADGFYFTTENIGLHPVGSNGDVSYFAPIGEVTAGLDASAAVNVGIAEAGVGGGVFAGLYAYISGGDVPSGGKLRLSQLLSGPDCLISPITGEFGVRVRAYITVGISPFDYTKRFDLVKKTLADFTYECPPPQLDTNGGLASFNVDTARPTNLYINAGGRAPSRIINHIKGVDTDEFFTVSQVGTGAVRVNAFTISDINGHPVDPESDDLVVPNRIIANMGAGGDQMVFDEDVQVAATLNGEAGDDLLAGGLANDIIDGGADHDHLQGRAGDDILNGGIGNDLIQGGAGADKINGGGGFDQVSYEDSTAGIEFKPTGVSGSFTGKGGDAEGDTLTGIEHVIGSHFDDRIYGNPGERNILEGLDGADLLVGGSKEDLLLGGGKGDNLYGGGGNDTVSYLTSAGQIEVDLGANVGKGGDAEGDAFDSIENIQGTAYDDKITGDNASNRLIGWFGDDVLEGGVGFDDVAGGAGDDIIYARGDGDKLNGDSEGGATAGNYYYPDHDLLSYEKASGGVNVTLAKYTFDQNGRVTAIAQGSATRAGSFTIDKIGINQVTITDPVNNNTTVFGNSTFEDLTGSDFNDTLKGDLQNNVIRGRNGNDGIDGLGGDDTIIGGFGADTMYGGDGRDLADYVDSFSGVTVSLGEGNAFGTGSGGDAQGDKLKTIEDLRGSIFADKLTGNSLSNSFDPVLSRFGTTKDVVNGGGGVDTLVLRWNQGDIGKGLAGGFATGSDTVGGFAREVAGSSTKALDRVSFTNVERIEVYGTSKGDVIAGGAYNDQIYGNDGADVIFTGISFDRDVEGTPIYTSGGKSFDLVSAGAGDDYVAVNTALDNTLSLLGTLHFGFINGGRGIDTLNASFAVALDDIDLRGTLGTTEYFGRNLKGVEGSAIYNFEILGAIATGLGNDTLVQLGRFNNIFATGYGRDTVAAGYGQDVVDGGLDFTVDEVKFAPNSLTKLVTLASDFSQVYASDGDVLEIDYRNGTSGIRSYVQVVDTGFTLSTSASGAGQKITTNNGFYETGDDRTQFSNFERVFVEGSKFGDQIFGTDLTYGLNRRVGPDLVLAAAQSARGDDVLIGYGGNDVIFGGTGSDRIQGGDGDDVLLGTAYPTDRTLAPADLGEIDYIVGGAGRDVFILGLDNALYNDRTSASQTSHVRASGENRAIVADFDRTRDFIVLSGTPGQQLDRPPSFGYVAVEEDGSTFIYLRDGRNADGALDASRNELVAELEGVTGFSLNSARVLYYQVDGTYTYGNGNPAEPPPTLNVGPGALPPTPVPAAAPASPAAVDHGQAVFEADLSQIKPPPSATSAAAAQANWVKQTDNPDALRLALFGTDSPIGSGDLKIDGDSVAVGTFRDDPFGLGSGIVISTGRVLDLPGANTIDGGRATTGTAELKFDLVGTVATGVGGNTSRIYRADLSALGFDLNSLRLGDASGGYGGGAGIASGFDIDALKLSKVKIDSFANKSQFENLSQIDAFSFDLGSVVYEPGTIRYPTGGAAALAGTENGLPLLDNATLDRIDGNTQLDGGSLTLGDGGSIGFDLSQTVKSGGPLYLYVVEAGGSGEVLTTGLTASSNRLEAPADLSTDLGPAGVEGDTTTLTYTFAYRDDGPQPTSMSFDVVFLSEEFAEFAQAGFNDKFKVLLNGVELARLSDGSFASIDTLYAPPAGPGARTSIYELRTDPASTDLIYNPAGTGPAAGSTRADGYSRILRLTGDLQPGENVLTIQVKDEGDGFLDSGLLIRGNSFVTETRGDFFIDRSGRPVSEGEERAVLYGVELPEGAELDGPVTVVLRPGAGIDLGEGAGVAIRRVLDPSDPVDRFAYTVLDDGRPNNSRIETIAVEVLGLPGTTSVAPLVINVDDSDRVVTYTLGDAEPREPDSWPFAWTHSGVTIEHTDAINRGRYSLVSFNDLRPEVIEGGDLYEGDLGVSGDRTSSSGPKQEISVGEAVRFTFDGGDVNALAIDFARFSSSSDRAIIRLFDGAGRLVGEDVAAESIWRASELDGVATVIVTAESGRFLIDSVEVTETVSGGGRGAAVVSPAQAFEAADAKAEPLGLRGEMVDYAPPPWWAAQLDVCLV